MKQFLSRGVMGIQTTTGALCSCNWAAPQWLTWVCLCPVSESQTRERKQLNSSLFSKSLPRSGTFSINTSRQVFNHSDRRVSQMDKGRASEEHSSRGWHTSESSLISSQSPSSTILSLGLTYTHTRTHAHTQTRTLFSPKQRVHSDRIPDHCDWPKIKEIFD